MIFSQSGKHTTSPNGRQDLFTVVSTVPIRVVSGGVVMLWLVMSWSWPIMPRLIIITIIGAIIMTIIGIVIIRVIISGMNVNRYSNIIANVSCSTNAIGFTSRKDEAKYYY